MDDGIPQRLDNGANGTDAAQMMGCTACGAEFTTPLQARAHIQCCPAQNSTLPRARTAVQSQFSRYMEPISRLRVPKKIFHSVQHQQHLQQHYRDALGGLVSSTTRVAAVGGLGIAAVLAKRLGAASCTAILEVTDLQDVAARLAKDNGVRIDNYAAGDAVDLVVMDALDIGFMRRGYLHRTLSLVQHLTPEGTVLPTKLRAVGVVVDVSMSNVSGFTLKRFAESFRLEMPCGYPVHLVEESYLELTEKFIVTEVNMRYPEASRQRTKLVPAIGSGVATAVSVWYELEMMDGCWIRVDPRMCELHVSTIHLAISP